MDAVIELLQSLLNVITSLLDVVVALVRVILPWLPLLAWIAYWSLCVNWVKAYRIIFEQFGWIGIVLLMFIASLVWSQVSPPVDDVHTLFGLKVSNLVGKFVFVSILTCIAVICGSVQMSGTFGSLVDFSDEEKPVDDHAPAPQAH